MNEASAIESTPKDSVMKAKMIKQKVEIKSIPVDTTKEN